MAHGIDLGTTYSAIAKIDETGAPKIIEDNQSARATLPSAVFFEAGGNIVVGASAKEAALDQPDRFCECFKRWIGRDEDPDREHYVIDGEEKNPIQLSAMVLGRIKEYAEANGETVEDVVITVPAYFTLAQRDATKAAGKIAGLNVLATINEPTAAALSFCHGSLPEDRIILVYDLGGGTFDITMLQMVVNPDNSMDANVLFTTGDAKLGGVDWDADMLELLKAKLSEATGLPAEELDEDVINLLKREAEGAKQQLSDMSETTVKIRYDGERHKLTVTREEFEAATKRHLDKTVSLMDVVLQKAAEAGITEDKIDLVLQVGGSTRMAQVQEMLNTRFPGKVQFHEPDKSVAMGAAIAADMIARGSDVSKLTEMIAKGDASKLIKVEIDESTNTATITDTTTGETTQVSADSLSEEVQEKAAAGEAITGTELVSGLQESATGTINITDVVPSTFGVIVATGEGNYICENFIKKDEQTPCEYTRTYAVPSPTATCLVLPVVESESTNEDDPAFKDAAGEYSFPDASLGHKVRTKLLLNIRPGLQRGTPVEVTVSCDNLANLHVRMTIPSTGETNEVDVNCSSVTTEQVAGWTEQQSQTNYVDYE